MFTAVHCWKQQMKLAGPQQLLCSISSSSLNFVNLIVPFFPEEAPVGDVPS